MMQKWDLVGLIHSSSYRLKVLKTIMNGKARTPKQISKESDIKLSHISGVLRKLEECGLVVCLNPKFKKGRLFIATKLGKAIMKEVLE